MWLHLIHIPHLLIRPHMLTKVVTNTTYLTKMLLNEAIIWNAAKCKFTKQQKIIFLQVTSGFTFSQPDETAFGGNVPSPLD